MTRDWRSQPGDLRCSRSDPGAWSGDLGCGDRAVRKPPSGEAIGRLLGKEAARWRGHQATKLLSDGIVERPAEGRLPAIAETFNPPATCIPECWRGANPEPGRIP